MTLWNIDAAHSEVKFKVRHLVISTVTGRFKNLQGTVKADMPDFSDAKITLEADVNSIDTGNEQRDGHLKSADFFDAEHHPKLSFVSKSFTGKDGGYVLAGDLTLRGVTKEVKLEAIYNGTVKGFEGDVAAFEISGKLNRQDFGLSWGALTETGGVVVGDEVKLEMLVELKKATAEKREAA